MIRRRIIGVYLFICLGFFYPLLSAAQTNEITETPGGNSSQNETFYKYALQAGTDITYTASNNAMVKTFSCIYTSNLSLDLSILKRLYIGAEVHDDELALAPYTRYGSLNPRMFIYMGGVRLGYHSSNDRSNNFLFNSSLTGGESHIIFTNTPLTTLPKGGLVQNVTSWFLNIGEYYRVADEWWIGINLSCMYLNYQFDPDYIGVQNSGLTYYPSDSKGPTIYAGWGFQVYYTFSKGKN